MNEQAKSALKNFKRQALHACDLGFFHPGKEVEMDFSNPLPRDYKNLLEMLELEDSVKNGRVSPKDLERWVSSKSP